MITLAEAKHHLRIDGTADDPWLEIFIPAITQAILLWLGDDWRAYMPLRDSNGDIIYDNDGIPLFEFDTNGEPILQPVVRIASLVELASQYRFREGEDGNNRMPAELGYVLGRGATDLLISLRKPRVV